MKIRLGDALHYAVGAAHRARSRTVLVWLAMTISVAAVVTLTALGDGARRYVVGEFSALGTHLLFILPGRNETTGGMPPVVGETPRDLTIDDAMAIYRVPGVSLVAPVQVGEVLASYGSRSRDVTLLGSTWELEVARSLTLERGRFLPKQEPTRAAPICVLGRNIETELFGSGNVIGEWMRVGDRRLRVIGVISSQGQSLGVDLDDVVICPVATAQSIFDTQSLFRMIVQARDPESIEPVKERIETLIAERHQGERDITIITQDSVLGSFDRILSMLTYTLGGIAAVSLAVAGVLIMNVMLVSVSQRSSEIGLLKAIGAAPSQIRFLILLEAGILSSVGAASGVLAGVIGCLLIQRFVPALPAVPPLWAVVASIVTAIVTGIVFAWIPARRAARLDAVVALSRR